MTLKHRERASRIITGFDSAGRCAESVVRADRVGRLQGFAAVIELLPQAEAAAARQVLRGFELQGENQ
jgi:hypothetical protein